MEDREILDVIRSLVAEEHRVRDQREKGALDPDTAGEWLREVEGRLDEMWGQLRARRAARAAGIDPDERLAS